MKVFIYLGGFTSLLLSISGCYSTGSATFPSKQYTLAEQEALTKEIYYNLEDLSDKKDIIEFNKRREELVLLLLRIGDTYNDNAKKRKNRNDLGKASLAYINVLKISGHESEEDKTKFGSLVTETEMLLGKLDFSAKSNEIKNQFPFLTWAWEHGLWGSEHDCTLHQEEDADENGGCDSRYHHKSGKAWNLCKLLIPPLYIWTVPETVVCGVLDLIVGWETKTKDVEMGTLKKSYGLRARKGLREMLRLQQEIVKFVPSSQNLTVDIFAKVAGYKGDPARLNRHIEIVNYSQSAFGNMPDKSGRTLNNYIQEFEQELIAMGGMIFPTSKHVEASAGKVGDALIQKIKLRGILPIPDLKKIHILDNFIKKYTLHLENEEVTLTVRTTLSFSEQTKVDHK